MTNARVRWKREACTLTCRWFGWGSRALEARTVNVSAVGNARAGAVGASGLSTPQEQPGPTYSDEK